MKKISILLPLAMMPLATLAQSPIDAYQLSQPDLKGTARFMSMGGAFGALGGDLSTLSQNPGGIGVYRSNDIGLTIDIDAQRSTSDYMGLKNTETNTKCYLNNIGVVGTLRLGNSIVPNLNLGFTYNKAASFNRRYSGVIPNLKTSLTNYIAGIANNYELTEADVKTTDDYDPYNPGYNQRYVPWAAILGYDSYMIDPEGNPDYPNWQGQFGDGTSGTGYYNIRESGYIDQYNIAFGGNIANKVFWGMNFGITSVDYTISSLWGEDLNNAYVYDPNVGQVNRMDASWDMTNLYNMSGNGFNYSLGVIVKPIQELRLGLSFTTPTWFKITENFYPDQVDYSYPFRQVPGKDDNVSGTGYAETNDGYDTYNRIRLNTPWKVIASVAGVIGSKAIISFDYEWNGFKNMSYHEDNSSYYDDYYPWDWMGTRSNELSPIEDTNDMIRTIYRNTNTIRIGAEYRVLSFLSLRAGYSWTSSPVTVKAKNNLANIPTAGTLANYRLDNNTNYITAGAGIHFGGFYLDGAYVWKHQTSEFYPFAPDPAAIAATAMSPKISFSNSQVVFTAGFRF